MRETSSAVPLLPISGLGASVVGVAQAITARGTLRGLPRLLWASHRLVVGTGMHIVWYQKRFRVACDCDSYYSLMTVCGFMFRSIDRLLSRLIQDGADDVTVVDVGAHMGFVSLLACSAAREGQRVHAHCFEPDPRALQWLLLNCSLNSYEMIPNDRALGAVQERVELKLIEGVGCWLLPEPPSGLSFAQTKEHQRVDVTTLDAYCQDQAIVPDIVKIDVEGYEPYVLRGGSRVLQQARPYLVVEINPLTLAAGGNSAAGLLNLMKDLGYKVFHVDHQLAGLSDHDVRQRQHWKEYAEVHDCDCAGRRLLDVLGVPSNKAHNQPSEGQMNTAGALWRRSH